MAGITLRDLLSPIAILAAGAMISGSVLWSMQRFVDAANQAYTQGAPLGQQQAGGGGQPPALAPDVSKISTEGVPVIGSPDAPVVMAYWFDYQCPYCRQMEETVLPRLIADYVQTGKLKILFKDFAFLGPDSRTAGLAAHAVWAVAPDRFLTWHQAMFAKQDAENGGWGNKEDVLALTRTIAGIDAAKVEELMSSKQGDYLRAFDIDGGEAGAMGIGGTPGAIINKQLLVGAQPYAQFKAAVDAALGGG